MAPKKKQRRKDKEEILHAPRSKRKQNVKFVDRAAWLKNFLLDLNGDDSLFVLTNEDSFREDNEVSMRGPELFL